MNPTDISRISKNILALLLNAEFPGSHSQAVAEAITFIEGLIRESDKKEETAHSDIDAKDVSGVDDSPVRNPRRKNSKNKDK